MSAAVARGKLGFPGWLGPAPGHRTYRVLMQRAAPAPPWLRTPQQVPGLARCASEAITACAEALVSAGILTSGDRCRARGGRLLSQPSGWAAWPERCALSPAPLRPSSHGVVAPAGRVANPLPLEDAGVVALRLPLPSGRVVDSLCSQTGEPMPARRGILRQCSSADAGGVGSGRARAAGHAGAAERGNSGQGALAHH